MTVLAVEPTQLTLLGPPGLTDAEQRQADQLEREGNAAKTLAEIALVLGGAFLLYRMFAARRIAASLPPRPEATTLRLLAMAAWHSFSPSWLKMTGGAVAAAYTMGVIDARLGDVPPDLLNLFAQQYAQDMGVYFNETSADALEEGFHAYVNRKLPKRMAAERVLKAYGITPKQMRAVVAAEQLGAMRVTTAVELRVDAKTERYVETQLLRRAQDLGDNEAFTAMRRGKQLTWMYLLKHNKISANAKRRWITAHDEKVCKYCGPLHGVAVGITEPFKTALGPVWVPSLHPNCRCDITLEIPTTELFTKRFDPSQRRDESGRWTDMGTRLNQMSSPAAKVETNLRHSKQAARYVVEPRYLTTPLRERDREMATLARGAALWSRNSIYVDRARKMSDGDNAYFAAKLRSKRLSSGSDRALRSLVDAVSDAPATAPTLYRGLNVTQDHLESLKPGVELDLPLSSFSASRNLSVSFATAFGPMIAQRRAAREGTEYVPGAPLLLILDEKAKALNISPLVAERQAEWISQGKFTVVGVDKVDDLNVVMLRQTSAEEFGKADWWRELDHPRDDEGRFTDKPRRTRVATAYAPEEVEEITPSQAPSGVTQIGSTVGQIGGATVGQIQGSGLGSGVGQITGSGVSQIGGGISQITMPAVIEQIRVATEIDEQIAEEIATTAAAGAAVIEQITTRTATRSKTKIDHPVYFIGDEEDLHRMTTEDLAVGKPIVIHPEDLFLEDKPKRARLNARILNQVENTTDNLLHLQGWEDDAAARAHLRRIVTAEVFGSQSSEFEQLRVEAQEHDVHRESYIQDVYVIDQLSEAAVEEGKGGWRAPGTYTVTGIREVREGSFPVRYIHLASKRD